MKPKQNIGAMISGALVIFGLALQPAQAIGSLTESRAIGKAQNLVDSLNNEVVAPQSHSDNWTSDFPELQTKLEALSVQLNSFGTRFVDLGSPFLEITSSLSNCLFTERSTDFTLTCDKSTYISFYAGEDEEPTKNELFVKIKFVFNLNGNIISWAILNGFANDSFPMDEINFINSSLDEPTTYPKSTRMLPPLDYSGLSDARKSIAAQYARDHVNNYNTNYIKYDRDCANFVSQAMKAAGWKTIGDGSFLSIQELFYWGYWNDNNWPNNNTTRTWYNADALYQFTITPNNSYATRGYKLGVFTNDEIIANKGLLEVGDLIFFNWDGPNSQYTEKDHVMIVTSVANGVVRLTGHNIDRNNVTISTILGYVVNGDPAHNSDPMPEARWFFVRT